VFEKAAFWLAFLKGVREEKNETRNITEWDKG